MITRTQPRLRADAARNRAAIVEAARELYRHVGLDVPFDEIARRSGLGNATAYRHFPTRAALVTAAYADALEGVIASSVDAMTATDPWSAFAHHVRMLCALQASDRGLADLFTTQLAGAAELERLRARAYRGFVRVADRARASGQLREDFVPADLAVLLMAMAGLVQRTADSAPTAWERFVDLALDGLRAGAAGPTAPPPRPLAVRRAMRDRGAALGYR